ncbi:jg19985 [Pararge aegeria aegeria]|uniref:Jg19985 protein n=1 Tax=Pararge aegeria aegeria TaxID=348720 RepID=A0A8S4R2Y0_9NEOP|nr:jg19985 [Pararge aegeria aegeria]
MNTDKSWPMHQLFGRRIVQRAKICLSDKQMDITPAILHPPEEKYTESNVSTSSLHTDEDLDNYIEIKIEPEIKIQPGTNIELEIKIESDSDLYAPECSNVDVDTSSTTEHILFVDPASTATSTSTEEKTENKQGKIECYICNRVIMFNAHTCNKCEKLIHPFCGLRLAVEPSSFEEFELVCNECKQ